MCSPGSTGWSTRTLMSKRASNSSHTAARGVFWNRSRREAAGSLVHDRFGRMQLPRGTASIIRLKQRGLLLTFRFTITRLFGPHCNSTRPRGRGH